MKKLNETVEQRKRRLRENARRYRALHPERVRAANARYEATKGKATSRARYLRVTYDLTPEAFAAMLRGQNDGCAICETDKPNAHGWCVDHDHATGRVRGILCHSCNSGIGALQDSATVIEAALSYLRRAQ